MTPIDSKSLVELYALLVGIHVLLVIHGKDPRPTNREPLTSGPDGETENGAGCVSVCVLFFFFVVALKEEGVNRNTIC